MSVEGCWPLGIKRIKGRREGGREKDPFPVSGVEEAGGEWAEAQEREVNEGSKERGER